MVAEGRVGGSGGARVSLCSLQVGTRGASPADSVAGVGWGESVLPLLCCQTPPRLAEGDHQPLCLHPLPTGTLKSWCASP